ncbi:nucleotide sugar dehydrogenase [Haladaptatus sp. NG-SE-30]
MSTICLHGLGYVGLPMAVMFANAGHRVIGYDTNEQYLEELEQGVLSMDEPELRRLFRDARESGALKLSSTVTTADYHVVAVPTPFDETNKRADLTYVRRASETVGDALRPGDTVVVESTIPPGTTENVVRPILEAATHPERPWFQLAYCPETILPGAVVAELRRNDRVIGGIDESSVAAARDLYRSIPTGEIRTVTDTTTAEFVKLIQNTYRDTNIALANEISKLARDYGIDSRRAIALANEHPRVELHQPGLGVGGHCLPVDPWFLGQESEHLDLVAHARSVNQSMVEYVAELLETDLDGLANARIAILGVAYKGNVTDVRNSPGLRLRETLQRRAADDSSGTGSAPIDVLCHDPYVEMNQVELQSLDRTLADADATVLATDHDEYARLDPAEVRSLVRRPFVLDTKSILDPTSWERAGFELIRL